MIKKLLLAAAVLASLAAIAIVIFIVTFDADRYRPLLVSTLERALGRPVRIERISVGWERGVALRLDGFAIYEDAAARGEPMIAVDTASALVPVAPLLRRKVEVGALVLTRPRILVTRDAQGRINLLGLAAAAAPAGAAAQAQAEAPVRLSIQTLRVEDGAVRWTDAMARPPADIRLTHVDLTVSNIAPGRPMDIRMQGALAGDTRNLDVSGRFTPPAPAQPGSLDALRVALDRVQLASLFPPAAGGGEPEWHGVLTLSLEGAVSSLAPEALGRAATGRGTLKLDDGLIKNLNVLRAVFERFTVLPGLVDLLIARLPEGYRGPLTEPDTRLSPVSVAVDLDGGLLRLATFSAGTDRFTIEGAGTVSLDGTVQIPSMLRVEKPFTSLLVNSVNELRALVGADGRLELPVAFQGRLPQVRPVPDLQYVTSRMIAGTLGGLLGGQASPPPASEPGDPGELLGQWLQRALQPKSEPSQAPQR